MSTLLKKTKLTGYAYHLHDGEQVVRNGKINALIETKLQGLKRDYLRILARPVFTTEGQNEAIIWQTDQFHSAPQLLSELTGDERAHYEHILKDAMAQYGAAVARAPKSVRLLLEQAITYHSLDNVFCGDNRVVITEWGIHPKASTSVNTISFDVDLGTRPDDTTTPQPYNPDEVEPSTSDPITKEEVEKKDVEEEEEKVVEEEVEEKEIPQPPINDTPSKKEDDDPIGPQDNSPQTPHDDALHPQPTPRPGCRPWLRKGLWALLAILLLILLLLALSEVFRRCSQKSDPMSTVAPVAPAIEPGDIIMGDDSLSRVVANRVVIMVVDGGSLIEFVSDLRQVYPNHKTHQLAAADTILNRITFIMPADEVAEFMDTATDKFPRWELLLLREPVYESEAVKVNDPYMADVNRRWYFDMCGIFDAWDITMGKTGVVVAVIDANFDLSHPEIASKVVKPYNAVTHTSNLTSPNGGHGTHVAATATGAADNSIGIAGIAPHCSLMPIQVANSRGVMSLTTIADGISYAIGNKADVVNISLGANYGKDASKRLNLVVQRNYIAHRGLAEACIWDRIFTLADQRNIIIVQSGGNDNLLVGFDPMKRSTHTIKVSAVQKNKYKADFSNYGSSSTLSAPGVEIFNAFPGNAYTFMSGTSMASPIVTGGIALMRSVNPTLTRAEAVRILQQTGLKSPSDVGPIVHFGNALKALQNSPTAGTTDCMVYQKRYNQLLAELEQLKKEHPDCIAKPDTMKIPVGVQLDDITGTWRSTTEIYNESEEEVVLYFTFNGTSRATLTVVEPSGKKYTAPLSVSINSDRINISQTSNATNPHDGKSYLPYDFVCKPDRKRNAECSGQNKADALNKFTFNLIKLGV